ncbi:uncharacterized protein SPSK_04925 [Sporothrix schenckii 1099-18]|uniref:Uncharacterized protein n=1 Tax=Sporothrix schenckii 1099-18 TaxID=1397361 RepID=A0A0F2LS78_SPOSC|nr:uncharacterized protein SPSK_04925 [Sporothrix schenckii 1099-18]KJR80368.1 hypothetical protein SPSK_04925 [Sporothrix schenckii 1099-18]
MRPASLQLRLAQPSCLALASALFGSSCGTYSIGYVPAVTSWPRPTSQSFQERIGFRFNSAAASPVLARSSTDHDSSYDISNAPSSLPAFPGHLKLRGPFAFDRQDDALIRPPTAASVGRWNISQRPGQLMLGAQHYGKWRELVFDYDRLMFESGLAPSVAASAGNVQRSVDRPENASDMSLWSAIFNFAQRRGDSDGALVVWHEIFLRRQLYKTDGVVANAFWMSVVGAALESPDASFLESTWAYAEWMYDTRGTRWPHYYRLVVSSFLDSGDYDAALKWHLRLSPHFSVPKRDFFDLLKSYITDPHPELQETLRYIYATSRHRLLYDTIVPLLWSHGHSALARAWRETLILHDDLPASSSSRPFLQFVAGYYPETELAPKEQFLVNTQPSQYLSPQPPKPAPKAPDLPTNLFHLMNRVHGETFGIQEKSFNDKIGSKWFATKWVSLDTAINMIYNLGIDEIGPLSLQSIALRSGDPASVLRSLEHLEQCHISIGSANYSKAIRYLARAGDAATLNELLQSSLHPAVFDDIVLQRSVLGSAMYTGDWKTHRLVLAVRLAVSEDALETSSNKLLMACVSQKKKGSVLRLLDEFSARGMEITPATWESLSHFILDEAPAKFDPNAPPDVDFYAALCRRLLAMRLPVATEAWQNILLVYGRLGRLDDLEKTALDIVDQYVSLQTARLPRKPVSPTASSAPPPARLPSTSFSSVLSSTDETSAFKANIADVPDIVRGETEKLVDLGYRLLPRDLPCNHPLHPLSLIFNEEIVASMVRWYFHRKTAYRQKQGARKVRLTRPKPAAPKGTGDTVVSPKKPYIPAPPSDATPSDFSLAGGIRLLAMLRDRGVDVSKSCVRSETLVCIVALFGPEAMSTRYWQPSRAANQLKLGEVKAFCDAAWASDRHDTESLEGGQGTDTLLPKFRVLKQALAAVKPVAASFAGKLTRPGDKKKASRDAFMEVISKKSPSPTA